MGKKQGISPPPPPPPSGSTGICWRTYRGTAPFPYLVLAYEYEEPQTRYDRSTATLPILKVVEGAVSLDPPTSPAMGRSQKRNEARSVRIGPREYTRGGLSHWCSGVKSAPYVSKDGY